MLSSRATLVVLILIIVLTGPVTAGAGVDRLPGLEPEPQAAGAPLSTPDELASNPIVVADEASDLPDIVGPPAPATPDMIRRDEAGKATIRAVRIDREIDLDGRLNEEIYAAVPPIGGFIQQLPIEKVPATEPTEVWVFFDDDTMYIAGRCLNSQPDRAKSTELRRDHINIFQQGDNVSVVLDTFYDRRNGFFFQTNALGALRDQAISEGQQIEDWNTVWDVRSQSIPEGWTFEMAIPFKSLRYRRPGPQIWGINFRRSVRWKNEVSLLTSLPASYGQSGVSQMDAAGTLVGLDAPPVTKNLELKPYIVSSVITDRAAAAPFSNDLDGNVGIDLKYGLTSSVTADVTVNTDFAQVEEDLQQVNLTRFSLQFPEKRDFFLEGQGIFAFGDRSRLSAGSDVPIVFFSRQIGLSRGQTVPVRVGGRVTGKVGAYDIGVLNIQTGEKESAGAVPTNFSVVRVKRDIFQRSSIGLIATRRFETSDGTRSNLAGGFDASLRLSDDATVTGYYAATSTPGVAADQSSYRSTFGYEPDRYGVSVEHLMVAGAFNPEIGFVRRRDFRRTFAEGRFSPRTEDNSLIRRFVWLGSVDYVTNAPATVLQNRTFKGSFDTEFHRGDVASVEYIRDFEFLPLDFTIAPGIIVPTGHYQSDTAQASYTLGLQRKVSGTASAAWGTFYDGTRTEATYRGRIGFGPHFAIEPSVTLNWVDLPFGDFTARLVSSRFIVTPTPRLSVTGLVQVNAAAETVSSSLRLRWEYIPSSELFLVYSDGRDTTAGTPIGLLNRSVAVKVTRLLRF